MYRSLAWDRRRERWKKWKAEQTQRDENGLELRSVCCDALPLGAQVTSIEDKWFGMCVGCRDHAEFTAYCEEDN